MQNLILLVLVGFVIVGLIKIVIGVFCVIAEAISEGWSSLRILFSTIAKSIRDKWRKTFSQEVQEGAAPEPAAPVTPEPKPSTPKERPPLRSQPINTRKNMDTVSFNHGKCDICGKEFMSVPGDTELLLQEVEWRIGNGPRERKNFCNDCLSKFIVCTSPTNEREGEAEASEAAKKFWRFFRKK